MNRLLSLTLALAMSSGGCSFIFATSAPDPVTAGSYPECGTPRPAIVGDAVIMALSALSAAGNFGKDGNAEAAVTATVMAALFASSTGWGLSKDQGCDEARQKALSSLNLERLRVPPPPPPLYPAATPPPPSAEVPVAPAPATETPPAPAPR